MTRVEWNLSDGELLSCRRRARLEKIMVALGRSQVFTCHVACGELRYLRTSRLIDRDHTVTQRHRDPRSLHAV
jgi:hypothetical protein